MFAQAYFPTALEIQRLLRPGMAAEFHLTQGKKAGGGSFEPGGLKQCVKESYRWFTGLLC